MDINCQQSVCKAIVAILLFFNLSAYAGRRKQYEINGMASSSSRSLYSPMLSFGDSTTDTGNGIKADPTTFTIASNPPYGMTYFKHPTGRFSDGRVMVDFLCQALNMSFLPPHLAFNSTSSVGASQNFAVSGATALNNTLLRELINATALTTYTLDVQLNWFLHDVEYVDLSNALVYFGEIGGDDYNYAMTLARKDPQTIAKTLTPLVIDQIIKALEKILNSGIKKLIVQGVFPMGCHSMYIQILPPSVPKDSHGCIASISNLSDAHNHLLKNAIHAISSRYPDSSIVFFDTTAAYLHILDYAAHYNFTSSFTPCFAEPMFTFSNNQNQTACTNPANYINWDGIHMTDAMYGTLVKLFLTEKKFSSPFPNFLTSK